MSMWRRNKATALVAAILIVGTVPLSAVATVSRGALKWANSAAMSSGSTSQSTASPGLFFIIATSESTASSGSAATSEPTATSELTRATESVPTEGAKSLRLKEHSATDSSSTFKVLTQPTKKPGHAPCVSWTDGNVEPKVAMLCIHGLSLHKGCFAAFGKEMAKAGIAAYAIDLRGFGELKGTTTEMDFDGCLADIKEALEDIHKKHPGLPVIILGESMGGAIALRTTALYPDLISGLISAVPARDRFAPGEGEVKVGIKAGFHILFGGFNKPIKGVAMTGVNRISDKPELRREWKDDPLMRVDFSPKEFLQFDRFMKENFEVAESIKTAPVLFIQGTNDKLIRPAGTWKLFERLQTPNRQLVLSKSSEHLIFEEGQFKTEDLGFVKTWIDRNVVHLSPDALPAVQKLPVVASLEKYNAPAGDTAFSDTGGSGTETASTDSTASKTNTTATSSGTSGANSNEAANTTTAAASSGSSGMTSNDMPTTASSTTSEASATASATTTNTGAPGSSSTNHKSGNVIASVPSNEQTVPPSVRHRVETDSNTPSRINYWIELYRDGKVYRCNNKTEFKTGDAIRFHVIPESNGYISLIMKESTTGKSQVLFPNKDYGTNNFLRKGQDYPIPSTSCWMGFDSNPGTEQLVMVFSREPMSITPESVQNPKLVCYVSPEESGAKDLVPTRMKLSWDDPKPVMIPEDFSAISQMKTSTGNSSLVRLISNHPDGFVAANIALVHH